VRLPGHGGLALARGILPGHAAGPATASCLGLARASPSHRAIYGAQARAHGFRHTHAFELSHEGVPLSVSMKQLGHNDRATTARYIDHLMPQQVVEAMQARSSDDVCEGTEPVGCTDGRCPPAARRRVG
jgi:integrase